MNDEILKELTYNGALLEDIRSQNKALLEGQKGQASSADVRRLQQDVTELKQDMKVVKAAVKATNSGMADLSHDLVKHKSLPAHVAHGHA
jgi:cell division protein FtsB